VRKKVPKGSGQFQKEAELGSCVHYKTERGDMGRERIKKDDGGGVAV